MEQEGVEGVALGSEAVTEWGGDGYEVLISLSFQDMNWWKVLWRKLSGSKAWSVASEDTERWSLEPNGECTSSA